MSNAPILDETRTQKSRPARLVAATAFSASYVTRRAPIETKLNTVPAMEFYDCSVCGAKVYDREAMLKIEACSPAYRKANVLAGV